MPRAADLDRFRVVSGKGFKLAGHDTDYRGGVEDKEEGRQRLAKTVERMHELQEVLYAGDRWAVLAIFQAMDGAGKDSTIEHVFRGVNPVGCQVFSFKAPSSEELDHDFLWRTTRCLPERGRIGVFNRSYYEEVLVVRVHAELLQKERLPSTLITDAIWRERFEDMRAFERYLARQGVLILKFFLNVSKEEQRQRFLARLEDPAKHWKFAADDVDKRDRWDDYIAAYEEMIAQTAAPHAPWYVIPADRKWAMHLAVAEAIVDSMEALDLSYPAFPEERNSEIESARARLTKE